MAVKMQYEADVKVPALDGSNNGILKRRKTSSSRW